MTGEEGTEGKINGERPANFAKTVVFFDTSSPTFFQNCN